MRAVIGLVVVAAAIVAAVLFVGGEFSGKVKAEMLTLVDRMDLSATERDEVRGMVESLHEAALEPARRAGEGSGKRFEPDKYLDLLFEAMVEQARTQGNDDLAEKLLKERPLVSLE